MSESREAQMDKHYNYMDKWWIIAAVVHVHDAWDEIKTKPGFERYEPGAEHWAQCTQFARPELYKTVLEEWLRLVKVTNPKVHQSNFFYHESAVVKLFVDFRKQDADTKPRTRAAVTRFLMRNK